MRIKYSKTCKQENNQFNIEKNCVICFVRRNKIKILLLLIAVTFGWKTKIVIATNQKAFV